MSRAMLKWPFNPFAPNDGDRVGFGRLMGVSQTVLRSLWGVCANSANADAFACMKQIGKRLCQVETLA